MRYDAIDIANEVILLSIRENFEVNNLKLQTILYFLQARSLIEQGELLFSEPIMKTPNGPVVPAVYGRYSHYGTKPFRTVFVDSTKTLADEEVELSECAIINSETKELIQDTLRTLNRYDAFQLIQETKRHPVWLVDMNQIKPDDWSIPYTEIGLLSTFSQHPQFRIWQPLYQQK